MDNEEAAVRRLALIVLGVVVVVIVAGLVVIAVMTDREMSTTGRSVIVGLVLIALTGGVVLAWIPHTRKRSDDDD